MTQFLYKHHSSVADPDSSDPCVFGPPGSGSGPCQSEVRIRTRLSSGKNSKKSLDSYCLVTSFDFLTLKNDVNVPLKVINRINFILNQSFVGILKVNDENSRIRIHWSGMDPQIRIRIRTRISWIRNIAPQCAFFLQNIIFLPVSCWKPCWQ